MKCIVLAFQSLLGKVAQKDNRVLITMKMLVVVLIGI